MSMQVKWKAVSVATMRATSTEMRVTTNTRRHENISRQKRGAKKCTSIRDQDFHIANGRVGPCKGYTGAENGMYCKRKGDELEGEI